MGGRVDILTKKMIGEAKHNFCYTFCIPGTPPTQKNDVNNRIQHLKATNMFYMYVQIVLHTNRELCKGFSVNEF